MSVPAKGYKTHLDKDELAFLRGLEEADPNAEYWTAHWAPMNLEKHGAVLGATYEGSYSVMKRLVQRGLVDKEGRMSHDTGVALEHSKLIRSSRASSRIVAVGTGPSTGRSPIARGVGSPRRVVGSRRRHGASMGVTTFTPPRTGSRPRRVVAASDT